MKKMMLCSVLFIPLGACAPKVQPICPDAIYNKWGYVQEDCRKSPPGFTLFRIPVSLSPNNAPESLSEPRGEGGESSQVAQPTPSPDRPSSEPPSVSQPQTSSVLDPGTEDTTPEEPKDEPKEEPPQSEPSKEPEADRPEPDNPSPSDGGDKSPHKDKTRPDKDHPKKSKAQGYK